MNMLNQDHQFHRCSTCHCKTDIETILTFDRLTTEHMKQYKNKIQTTTKIRVYKRFLFAPASYMYGTSGEI